MKDIIIAVIFFLFGGLFVVWIISMDKITDTMVPKETRINEQKLAKIIKNETNNS